MEKRLHHHFTKTFALGKAHQAMGIDAGRHAPHQVKAKANSLGPAKFRKRILQAPSAILPAEFARDKFRAGNSVGRDVGVEQEGAPKELGENIGPGAQGAA